MLTRIDAQFGFIARVPNKPTVCSVAVERANGEIGALAGVAFCAPSDLYKFRTGMRLAFARAVSVLTHEERKQAWEYLMKRNPELFYPAKKTQTKK